MIPRSEMLTNTIASRRPIEPSSFRDRASQDRKSARPNSVNQIRYRKGKIATILAGGALTATALLGTSGRENHAMREASQLASPAGQVAAELRRGDIDPDSVKDIALPTIDTPSGEASDLVRGGIVKSSARDEVGAIILGQIGGGEADQGTGVVLPKTDLVDPDHLPPSAK